MVNKMKVEFEYTDTFGAIPNYSWVKRESFDFPDDISDLALVRRAKAWARLNGIRTTKDSCGNYIVLKPYSSCTILFIIFRY
jgi:hypothetical protein